MRKWTASLVSSFALAGIALVAHGAAAADADNAANPAHFTVVQGRVDVAYPSGAHSPAAVDALLFPGNYVTTGPGARAEVQFNESTMLRLAGGVQARLTANADYSRHVQLADGTIEVAILRDGEGLVEVDTPSATLRARNAGSFRITIERDGTTYVTARRGRADVVTPARTYSVDPGTTLVAGGEAAHPHVSYIAETAHDAFDDFNTERDGLLESALSESSSSLGYVGESSSGYYSDQQSSLFSSSCATSAPLGVAYYGFGYGFSTGYGMFGGGCQGYGGPYTPFAWSYPYYTPYWPIAYWPWYPIWYPYPPFPYPPPRHHHPLPPPRRPLPPPPVITPVHVASVRPIVAHVASASPIVAHVAPTARTALALAHAVPAFKRTAPIAAVRSDSNVPIWRRFDAARDRDRAPDASWDRFSKTRGDVVIPEAGDADSPHFMSAPVGGAPSERAPIGARPIGGVPVFAAPGPHAPAHVGPITGTVAAPVAAPPGSAPHAGGSITAPAHVTGSASAPHGGGGRPPR